MPGSKKGKRRDPAKPSNTTHCSQSYTTRHTLEEATTNLYRVLKSGDIPLLAKIRIVKATFFPGVMYGCESWTIKKAKCRRTDAFQLWC